MSFEHTSRLRRRYLLGVILVLLLSFGLRSIDILKLPVFLDEAIHIDWARQVLRGETFIGLRNNKWLYPIVLSPFNLTGPESLWLARTASALIGMVTTTTVIALGYEVSSRRTGLLAGLIYSVLPFAVFHERQALVDPLLVAFCALVTLAVVRVARRPGAAALVLLGVSLAGAYATKVAALPYFALPALAIVLLGRSWRNRSRALLLSFVPIGAASAAIALLYQQGAQHNMLPAAIYQIDVGNFAAAETASGPALSRLGSDLTAYGEILILYVGWGMLALIVLAGLGALRGRHPRETAFLLIPALGFVLLPVLASRPAGGLAPRYLLSTAAPLAILAALGLSAARALLETIRRTSWLLVVCLVPALWFDARLILTPRSVKLTSMDAIQYQTGDPSGYGRDEIAAIILDAWRARASGSIDVLIAGSWEQIAAYLGPRVGSVQSLHAGQLDQRQSLAEWLARGDRVFVVEGNPDTTVPDRPHGARLELISSFDSGSGPLRLFEVIGAEGNLAADIYTHLGPDSGRLSADYAFLAADPGLTGSQLIIFPPSHAEALQSVISAEIFSLAPSSWPAQPENIQAAFPSSAQDSPAQRINLILVDETVTDPTRSVQLAFQQEFYYVSEAWFGLLHRQEYVTGPLVPALSPTRIQYQGGIELSEGAVVDAQTSPGSYVRMALAWRTPVQIADSFSVFVHLVDGQGMLRAQHDGIPGAGLFPMSSWASGQTIVERFAIFIPTDIPPGEYEVRVGIYAPGSGLRLPIVAAPEAGPDYAIVGRITVAAGP